MTAMQSPTREQAARLLGVAPDADAVEVKRAFRLWATWAHPDQGGSAEQFAHLCAARDRLLQPRAVTPSPPSSDPATIVARPRRPWRHVLARPAPHVLVFLFIGYVAAVSVVLVARVQPMPWGAVPAALAAAAWCVVVSRSLLRDADHGHVIVTRSVAWLSVMVGQLALAAAAGIALVEALPLLAVPFVAVIAAVNPAPGLWRSASR
jgi:hypothetical protein